MSSSKREKQSHRVSPEETAAEKRGCYGVAENIVVTLDGSKTPRGWTLLSRVLNFASASGRDHWVKDDERRLFARPSLRPMLFTLESYFCVSWGPTGSRSTRLRFLDARLEFGLWRTGRSVPLGSWERKRRRCRRIGSRLLLVAETSVIPLSRNPIFAFRKYANTIRMV